ncbi:hypothetical protein NIES4071_64990 [Calothrix sp. NIES-4071]|nr:hypothetical protein NIES4071_64990 [Calothrix sp. NIES-4071]BAZ60803.1 hypothetical protein NIES4105_64950 [Calothrix sp. NIES-4105]
MPRASINFCSVTPSFAAAALKSGRGRRPERSEGLGGFAGTPKASFNFASLTPSLVAAAAKSGRRGRPFLSDAFAGTPKASFNCAGRGLPA